jgi:hypothetical protein
MSSSGMLCHAVLTRATWCNILEDAILHSHRHEYLKSYMKIKFMCSMYAHFLKTVISQNIQEYLKI